MVTQEVENWLIGMENQLRAAKRVFDGGAISAVALDPVGFKFPRDFYPHLLRYQPGIGLVPAEINRAYMGTCSCPQCLGVLN